MSVFEQAKGKVKEAVGDVTDNDSLKKEGEAQAHEKKAELHEEKQKLAEETS